MKKTRRRIIKVKPKKKFPILLVSSIAALVLIIIISIYTLTQLFSSQNINEETYVTIPKNSNVESAITCFNKEKMLKPHWFYSICMNIYSKFSGKGIFAGCYKIQPDNTNLQIIKSLFSGNQLYTVEVTYPEGITLAQFASISTNKLGIDSVEFINLAHQDSLLKAYNIKSNSAEGYLMPDTYEFYWKQAPIDILSKLLSQAGKIWNSKFSEEIKKNNLSKHEILTLASIIEAESPHVDERPCVAGVYMNRLKLNWKLEADPTVSYALNGKKHLTFKDLEYESPFNTYKNFGLPPGPINSPSISSIEAALNPEKNDFLFFVAVGDGSMRHNFSKNMTAHSKNIIKYKKNLKKNK